MSLLSFVSDFDKLKNANVPYANTCYKNVKGEFLLCVEASLWELQVRLVDRGRLAKLINFYN